MRLLRRRLVGQGFHLILETDIVFDTDTDTSVNTSDFSQCIHWATIEQLPPGAFFDPHELQRLSQHGGMLGGARIAHVLGHVPLETPTEQSPAATAIIHGVLKRSPGELHVQSALPLHLRYSAPGTHGVAQRQVELPPPAVYLCCATATSTQTGDGSDIGDSLLHGTSGVPDGWCETQTEVSDLAVCAPYAASPTEPACGTWQHMAAPGWDVEGTHWLRASVPIGRAEHTKPVALATTFSVLVSMLWLLRATSRKKVSV
jgi:hypothetical protein